MRWPWNRIESDRLRINEAERAAGRQPAERRSGLPPAAAERSPVRPAPSDGRIPSVRRSPGGRSPLHRRTSRRPRCRKPTCHRPKPRRHPFHRRNRTGSIRCCNGCGRPSHSASGNSGGGAAQRLHPCRRGTPSGRRSAPRRFASCQSLPGLEQMGSVNARRQALRHRGLRPQTRPAPEQMPFHPAQNDNPSEPAQIDLNREAQRASRHGSFRDNLQGEGTLSIASEPELPTHLVTRALRIDEAERSKAARCSANVRRVRSECGSGPAPHTFMSVLFLQHRQRPISGQRPVPRQQGQHIDAAHKPHQCGIGRRERDPGKL